MTRLEFIQSCSKEELARFLCDMHDNITEFHCGLCAANEQCQYDDAGALHTGNGFHRWLEEDIDE